MPLVKQQRKISPLDLNKNVTIGVAFPLDETNMFAGTKTIKEQIKANLINLLLTYPGERVNLPTYGLGLKHLLFEQDIDTESLQLKIQTQMNNFLPEVSLKNISTGLSEDEHTLHISLTYTYILDNSTDQIQINFK